MNQLHYGSSVRHGVIWTVVTKSLLIGFCTGLLPSTTTGAFYSILDLGTLGGTSSYATAVNASGQVVGYSQIAGNGLFHAFRTAENSPINGSSDLGTLVNGNSQAFSINAVGQVVGFSDIVTNTTDHAFRTSANGSITPASDLGTKPGLQSIARGINSSGQSAGYVYSTQFTFTRALTIPANGDISTATDLGDLGGPFSTAYGINDSGQVVGFSDLNSGGFHAFRTAPNATINPTSDLGTLGGTNSGANAINKSGQVVGSSDTLSGASHAFRTLANAGIISADDLGTLGGTTSLAQALNDSGQVVGKSDIVGDATKDAFFVDVGGSMQDLNNLIPANSGWVLSSAPVSIISDRSSATASLVVSTHAFLLTPVPEPGNFGSACTKRWSIETESKKARGGKTMGQQSSKACGQRASKNRPNNIEKALVGVDG